MLYKTYGPYLEAKGYNVINIDFIHPETSLRYNPIANCKTTTDVRKLAHILVYEMNAIEGRGRSIDPFWDETAEMLITAVIGYIIEAREDELPKDNRNLLTLINLIKESNRTKPGTCDRGRSLLDERMADHRLKMECDGLESWAADRFDDFNTAPNKTHATVNLCALAKLSIFDTVETRHMLMGNDINFERIGTEKTALFVEVSDTDRSADILVNVFYTQLMNALCTYADDKCEDNRLPIPVQFILDDFATNARINNFQNMIANIRSREISAMLMVQSEAQLWAGYREDAQTIVDNCNTYVYMGGSNPAMAEIIGKRADKPATRILNMDLGMSWIFRRGEAPVLCENFDLERFKAEKFKTVCDKEEPIDEEK
jgi:type IV secretion system protein VirD4